MFLFGGAVVLLFAGVFVFDRAHSALPRSQQELGQAESDLSDAHILEHLVQQNKLLLDAADTLQQHAQVMHVLPQIWGERQINLRQQHLMREEINHLLMTTPRAKGQIFKPEEFDLSVTRPDEGLFEIPDASKQSVLITLRGTVHFAIAEGSL